MKFLTKSPYSFLNILSTSLISFTLCEASITDPEGAALSPDQNPSGYTRIKERYDDLPKNSPQSLLDLQIRKENFFEAGGSLGIHPAMVGLLWQKSQTNSIFYMPPEKLEIYTSIQKQAMKQNPS